MTATRPDRAEVVDGGASEPPRRQPALRALSASFSARALRAGGRLLAFAVAAWLFPLQDVGVFSFWLAAGGLSAVASDLGLSEHLTRAVPGSPGAMGVVRAAVRARLIAMVPAALLGWLVGLAFGGEGSVGALGAFAFGCAVGFSDFLAAVRRATGRFEVEILESGVVAGTGLAFGLLATAGGGGFDLFQVALGVGSVAAAGARAVVLAVGSAQSPDEPRVSRIVKDARWLWAKSLLGWGYLDATVLLVGLIAGPVQVALFAGAARLVGLMTQPLMALTAVFTPALAHEARFGREGLERMTRRLNRIGLAAVGSAFGFCVVLGRLGLAGLGSDFGPAEPVLVLLALGFAVHSSLLNTAPLVVLGWERSVVLSALGGHVVLWVTTLLAGRGLGAVGAAIGVLACFVAIKGATVAFYRRARLPLGSSADLAALIGGSVWLLGVWSASGLLRWAGLVVGALASGIVMVVLIRETEIFGAGTLTRR